MGQALGFGHCKESASTVSTTPDSTPSSTEGVSEDFLEPRTAQDLSDDDAPTDASLYWGTPRQLSLDSAVSCGAPLMQAGCFPAIIPSDNLSDLAGRGFGDGGSASGVSVTDLPQRTKKQPRAPRGLVRTETIETFLAEEKDEVEECHIRPPGMTDEEQEGRERASEPRDGTDCDPMPSGSVPSASAALPLSQDSEEAEVPRLGVGGTGTEPQVDSKPTETCADQKDREGPDAEVEGDLVMEDIISNKAEVELTDVLGVLSLPTEPLLLRVTEEELPSSDPSLPSVSEVEGEVMVVPGRGEGMGTAGVVQAAGLVGTLMPTGAVGIADGVLPGGSDSGDTDGRQHPLFQLTAPRGSKSQEVLGDEAPAENRQSPRQRSALGQSDHHKTGAFNAADQSVIDLLYWEDVKKTGTLFGAIILALFSLTQFSSVSVLAYLALSALSVNISLRLYTSVLHLIYKTLEVHPFQSYLDLDISLSQEELRKYSETMVFYLTSTVTHLRRLILVEDLLDSLKFGVLLWLLTYIGALFNGLTLAILVVVGAFIVPLIYRKHKVQINQYLGLLRGQIKDVTAKIQAKLPGSRPKAE